MNIRAKDIAQKLGISSSAVSLALNGKPGVSEKTRKLVLAEAYGSNNPKMQYLAESQITSNVRFVVFLDDSGTVANETSFHTSILQGIEIKAKEYGYNILVSFFHTSADWASQIEAMSKDVSGIILLATDLKEEHIQLALKNKITSLQIPLVLVDNANLDTNLDCIYSNSFRGAKTAVTYLLEKGHTDVGYLRSSSRIGNFTDRENGFIRARKEFGLTDSAKDHMIDLPISSEKAYLSICSWLEEGNKPASAYFAENDIIAAASIKAFKQFGYRIPEDISIIGFDDIPLSSLMDPPLTTVGVMMDAMGGHAMRRLHFRITEGNFRLCDERIGAIHIMIQPHLVIRESVSQK